MKDASNTPPVTTLPATPPNGRTGGIDWARDDHAVSIVDAAGGQPTRFTVTHTDAGLRESCCAGSAGPVSARSRSNAPTARSLMRCSAPG